MLQGLCETRVYTKTLKESGISCNRCDHQRMHEISIFSRDFVKSLVYQSSYYAKSLNTLKPGYLNLHKQGIFRYNNRIITDFMKTWFPSF